MPAMSSASVAVTAPSVSRTRAVGAARLLAEDRRCATASAGMTTSVASASFQERMNRITAAPTSVSVFWIERRDAVGDELVERLDVVRDPADEDAGAVALVEPERQPLQVAEEVVAEVGEHPLAGPAGEVRLRVGEDDADDADRDERDHDPAERAVPRAADLVDGARRSGSAARATPPSPPSSETIAIACAACTAARAGRAP